MASSYIHVSIKMITCDISLLRQSKWSNDEFRDSDSRYGAFYYHWACSHGLKQDYDLSLHLLSKPV